MQVGDYVRTKYGNIGKITNLNKQFSQVEYKDNQTRCDTNESNILKSSPNIIDLIELGDLAKIKFRANDANIFEVVAIDKDNNEIGIFKDDFEFYWVGIEQLNSIVTKEQFSQMEYKIGE